MNMSNPSSIENVQDAESKAKKIIEDAQKSKAEKISKAMEKARKEIEEAQMQTKSIKESAMKKVSSELERDRERKLRDARAQAAKIQKKELSKNALNAVVDKLVKHIFS